MKRFFKTLLISTVSLICLNVNAQNYPIKPIKILLPLPAGGALEIFSRSVAEIASQQLG
jgi:tripartite-type tricarboxylate transporter receptor subunit TctC